MSDDDVLIQGREVEAADLRVESTHDATLPQGLVYLGFACWLGGPMRALTNLPSDLSTASAATFEPAIPLMALGFALVAFGGVLAVLVAVVALGELGIRLNTRATAYPVVFGAGILGTLAWTYSPLPNATRSITDVEEVER